MGSQRRITIKLVAIFGLFDAIFSAATCLLFSVQENKLVNNRYMAPQHQFHLQNDQVMVR